MECSLHSNDQDWRCGWKELNRLATVGVPVLGNGGVAEDSR